MYIRAALDIATIIICGFKAFHAMVEYRHRFWMFQSILYAFFAQILYIASQYSPAKSSDLYIVDLTSMCAIIVTIMEFIS